MIFAAGTQVSRRTASAARTAKRNTLSTPHENSVKKSQGCSGSVELKCKHRENGNLSAEPLEKLAVLEFGASIDALVLELVLDACTFYLSLFQFLR